MDNTHAVCILTSVHDIVAVTPGTSFFTMLACDLPKELA